LVPDGARVGLGSGTTVAHLLPALAERGLRLRCVATSPATERQATELGLSVEPLDDVGPLDLAIDGADQIDPAGWMIKGGGGAHTREKIVATAAARFIVIVSSDKLVPALRPPVPLEILTFAAETTLARVAPARWRDLPTSPDGNRLAVYVGEVGDPEALAGWLSGVPGLVEHGVFSPAMVSDVLIAGPDGVEHRQTRAG
jgi:ribose 5-phosphate isomerase A